MSVRPTPRFASVEDVDESSGDVIEETRKYAQSVASPSKERSNTSKPRKEGRRERRDSLSPPLTDSDSTAHPLPRRESRSKPPKDERSSSKRAVVTTRPQPKHSKTMPPASSYYGVPATVTTSTSRPRASTRPASYYATSRPPPANARWYSQQPAPPPPPSIPASYPAQPWTAPQALIYPGAQPVVQQDYFAARPLEHRFGRPNSAMGYRQPRPSYEEYEQENERPVVERVSRRSSLQKKMFKREEDARAMPPPQRPATTRPTSSAPFRPPPTTPARRSLVFDSDDLSGHADLFQDISPQPAYGYGDAAVMRSRTRRPSIGAPGISYDAVPYQTEIARRPSRSGRRSSYLSGGYEDKLREATAYQNDVGTATIPLTEESLRKASKNSASSRSTRSSGSQDESDYRHSATTRTTRSSGEEDVTTIRAKGNIKFTIGDAEMRCEDGAEISFSSTRPGYRGGSDKSSYMDQDDRRTRYERPATRTRTSSQSGSYSRTMPTMPVSRYEAVYDHVYPPSPYEIPPYPAYPTHPTGSFF